MAARPIVVRSVAELRAIRAEWAAQRLSVALVPTMGALHFGHACLARSARQSCNKVVTSIFVNPAQFAINEDLHKYPRTEQSDVALLAQHGTDVVFAPSVDQMYPAGINLHVAQQTGAFVEVKGKSHQMEGSIRPHFFRGVATVVTKLFNIIQPTHAFFGQKDVQQCSVIRSMVRDLFMPVDIMVVPTVREQDGLAMSSRNRFLSESERKIAPVLYRGLLAAQHAFTQAIAHSSSQHQPLRVPRVVLITAAESIIRTEPSVTIDYISIADPSTLTELDEIDPTTGAILSGAICVGSTRIIDNLLLGLNVSQI